MKKFLILTINIYQGFISSALKSILGIDKMCRFSPTCSEYAKRALNKDDTLKGLGKSAIRIFRCQPFLS